MVVIYKMDDYRYMMADHSGQISIIDIREWCNYLMDTGIANGKVVRRYNIISIEPLKGEYETKLPDDKINILNSKLAMIGAPYRINEYSGISVVAKNITSIVIPDAVKVIPEGEFRNCVKLERVTMSDNVQYIGNQAFNGCLNLREINITGNLGDYALGSCISLEKVTLSTSVKELGVGAFESCKRLKTIDLPRVHRLRNRLFEKCSSLYKIVIPNSVRVIDSNVFRYCPELLKIEIPSSVKSIGDKAFRGCSSLTEIIIPSSVTYIGSYAFSHCMELKNVILPESLKRLKRGTFNKCLKIKSINLENIEEIEDSGL